MTRRAKFLLVPAIVFAFLLGTGISTLVESGGYNFFPGLKVTSSLGMDSVGTISSNTGVWAPVLDGGAVIGTTGNYSSTVKSHVASGNNGFACVTNGCRIDVGEGANDYFTASGGTITCNTDFNSAGFSQSVTASGGFRSSGTTSALIQGFPNNGATAVGVRINAGTALSTDGALIAQFENQTTAYARVEWDGHIEQLGRAPRKEGRYTAAQSTDTALTVTGWPNPSLLAGTPTADITDTAYQMIKFTTGTSTNNASGYAGPFTLIRATALPMLYFVVRSDPAAITSVRYIVGFAASSLDQVGTLGGADAIRGCWVRYDTGLSDANWQACSSDGTTASCTDSGVALATATTYQILIDNSTSGTCNFHFASASTAAMALRVSKSTNIPTSSTVLGPEVSVTTLTNAARALSHSITIGKQL